MPITALFVAALLALQAEAPVTPPNQAATKTVHAQGIAPGQGSASRSAAVLDAKRTAIQGAVKEVLGESFPIPLDSILRTPEPYVLSYSLTGQQTIGENTVVDLDLQIDRERLRSDIASALLPQLPFRPCVLIAIAESPSGHGSPIESPQVESAGAFLLRTFTLAGFRTVDMLDALVDSSPKTFDDIAASEPGYLAMLARECRADAVITGTVRPLLGSDAASDSVLANRARAELKVVRARDAQIAGSFEAEAVVQGSEQTLATAIAGADAVAKLSDSLLTCLVLACIPGGAQDITLTIEGQSVQRRLEEILAALKNRLGAGETETLRLEPNVAWVRLPGLDQVQPVLAVLTEGQFQGFYLKLRRAIDKDLVFTIEEGQRR